MTEQDAELAVSGELEDGERVLWSGVPRQGLALRGADVYLIPFSLMWGGFAIFWESSVFKTNAPIFFRLWGVPFVVIGLYLIFGRFFADSMQRGRTAYGLTDRRVVILSGLFSRQVKSLPLRTISDLSLTERKDGTGTIALGPSQSTGRRYGGGAWPGYGPYGAPCLEMIPNAKDVYNRIRQAQAQS